jgi:hypothetical protein
LREHERTRSEQQQQTAHTSIVTPVARDTADQAFHGFKT